MGRASQVDMSGIAMDAEDTACSLRFVTIVTYGV